jgi:ubiquinol-cytochrome c reductase subunit 8
MLRTYLFNFYRRASAEALYILVPFGIGYGIYSWARRYDAYLNSKAGHIAMMEHGEH